MVPAPTPAPAGEIRDEMTPEITNDEDLVDTMSNINLLYDPGIYHVCEPGSCLCHYITNLIDLEGTQQPEM